jgi:hypothetical protein
MSKVLDYIIEIRDRGEKIPVAVKIDFVSNWCVREYNDIFSQATEVQKDWDDINNYTSEISALKIEKPEGYKEQIADLQSKLKAATTRIITVGNSDILSRRFTLIKRLLVDNGINDERLLSDKVWDEQIDPAQAVEFLAICIYKDIDKKKLR